MTMQPRSRARVAPLSALVVLAAVGCGAGAGPAQPPTTDTSSTDVADDADVDPEVDAAQEDDDVAEGTESSANRMHGDAGEDTSQQLPPVDMEARSACSDAHPEIRGRSRYPGADDAYEALANAVCLRRALGDEDGAAEDLLLMRKNYGRKRDVEVSCPREAD